jgi:ABC-type branched-subunit amino acid transport system substrate-binding protein
VTVATALAVAGVTTACGTTLHRGLETAQQQAGATNGTATSIADGASPDEVGSSGEPGAAGSGTATTAAAGKGSASTPTGPADTSPITLGFLTTETGNAGALGVSTGQAFTHRQVTDALVKALNAQGGIAGRQIRPVVARTDTASVSWETDFAAACASFTQDNDVAAVLGYAFAFFDSFESCLSRAGVTHLSTSYAAQDAKGLAQYPHLYLLATPSLERYWRTAFQGAVGSGFLTPSNTVGVMRSGCAADRRAWEDTAVPLAKELKINVAISEEVACINGSAGTGSVITQLQSAVLRFRARGVDTVMVEGPPAIIFTSAAESQGWHPRYLATSESGGAALTGNVVPGQIVNIQGFGWLPSLDVLPANQPARPAAQQRCLDLLKAQGLVPTQHGDYTAAFLTCDAVFLYEAALKATNGNSDATAISAAIDAMGDRYQSAVTLDGRTRFGGRHDAPALARPWAWNTGCGCFQYTGSAYGI